MSKLNLMQTLEIATDRGRPSVKTVSSFAVSYRNALILNTGNIYKTIENVMLCFGYNIKYLRKIQKYDHKNNITQIKLNESIFLNIFILLHLLISLYQTVSLISLQTALNSRPSGLSSPQYKFPNP